MGVSGCGKTTIGRQLSARLCLPYLDGDAYHPPANVKKMRCGLPLDDADRLPWIKHLNCLLKQGPVMLGCSALKRKYRDILRADVGPVMFVHLSGDREVIAARAAAREGHFMPPSLLDSQYADLEPPQPEELSVTVDVGPPLPEVVEAALQALAKARESESR